MITLLLIRPGPLLDGLDALLISLPEVQLVAHSSSAEAALGFCRQNKTELIILEVRHDNGGLLNVVPEMKTLFPQGNVLALIHDESDRQSAELAQVDRILSIGIPASKLKIEIEELARTSETAEISSEEEFE
jgi:DNA-binding NarL/FixJ family response regulator